MASPRTPIIVTHLGNPSYLINCIDQAKITNPKNPIILIGDQSNRQPGVQHFDIYAPNSPILEDVCKFRNIYKHNSHLRPKFESFCIERWFLVRNVMRHLKLKQCCAIDSDVLLFCRIDDEAKTLQEYSMTFCEWDQEKLLPHFNLIQNLCALESFCEFVLYTYHKSSHLQNIISLNQNPKGYSWVSDMSLFRSWSTTNTRFKVAIFDNLDKSFRAYDPRISSTTYFVPSQFNLGLLSEWKKLRFRDGCAQAQYKCDHSWQTMKAVHYHGIYKALMNRHSHYREDNFEAFFKVLFAKFCYELKRIVVQLQARLNHQKIIRRTNLGNTTY